MTVLLELGGRLAITGGLLLAAAAVLGPPNLSLAADFFVSPVPTYGAALAAAGVLVWAIVAGALGLNLSLVLSAVLRRVDPWQRHRLWGSVVMLAGLLIMAAGLSHHYTGRGVTLGGGSVQEARLELAR